MKKITTVLICVVIMMSSMCIFAAATSDKVYTYEFDGIEYTVEISDESISEEKKQAISQNLIRTDNVQTYGLGCTLFGHDYKYTTASVIQHKVSELNPRCKKQTYDVTYCEDCDYTKETLVNTTYINCCPED